MEIIEYTGIVRSIIDAINTATADGLSTVSLIKLTRAEMDEFVKHTPYIKNVGKYYGDADVPPMMHITNNAQGQITGFYLNGVEVVCVE